ncbi:MAG: hypothetical protein ACI9ON_000064 [Limisphaerales bacterium]|jgi:hypothetical protein
MDWTAYKIVCDQPDTWSRWMLSQCAQIFDQVAAEALAGKMRAALNQSALPVPDDFRGGTKTHMFRLQLSNSECRAAVTAVRTAQRLNITSDGTEARGLAGFEEAWLEYAQWRANCDG